MCDTGVCTGVHDMSYRLSETGAIGVMLKSPQMETLMILVFISASLWGCLGFEFFGRHIGHMQRQSFHIIFK